MSGENGHKMEKSNLTHGQGNSSGHAYMGGGGGGYGGYPMYGPYGGYGGYPPPPPPGPYGGYGYGYPPPPQQGYWGYPPPHGHGSSHDGTAFAGHNAYGDGGHHGGGGRGCSCNCGGRAVEANAAHQKV